jgi:hypothetical protein
MQITFDELENGEFANANDINDRLGKVADAFNGHVDTDNLENEAVTREKLAPQSVTSDKLNFSKTVDANGWTVYDYGIWKEYFINLTVDVGSLAAGANVAANPITLWPVGRTETDLWVTRSYTINGNAPFFKVDWEFNTLYITNVTAGASDPGQIVITLRAVDR